MVMINLATAKTRLSELLDQVEGGEDVVITRHGRPVARITPIESPKRPVPSLAEFRGHVPGWRVSSAKLLRDLRDEALS